MKKRMSKSLKKYIRKQKAEIRKQFLSSSDRKEALEEKLKKVGLIKAEKTEQKPVKEEKKVEKKPVKKEKPKTNKKESKPKKTKPVSKSKTKK